MSTLRKIGGSQYKTMRARRQEAMKFFQTQTRLPPPMGFVAAAVLKTLQRIHKDSTLNGPEKDREFKRVIQAGHAAGSAPVAAVPGIPATEQPRPVLAEPRSDDAAE